ncbi:MAG: acetolactate synthase small subunit [Sporomusaceae bacterium]|jgi:acetolactate synthase-1/3 small subunit|nr:acetolactate synthase small subunit [Sporomusaceae bacterium]
MSNIISILVQNKPGVLVRVASMFSRRGFNIDSLTVGVTQDAAYSRMTVAAQGNEAFIEQLKNQIAKLVEVEHVQILPSGAKVARSMALLKVWAGGDKRNEILKLSEVFRAAVVDIKDTTVTFEITGDDKKIEAFADVLKPYGLLETIRTGLVALERGENTIYNNIEEREQNEKTLL